MERYSGIKFGYLIYLNDYFIKKHRLLSLEKIDSKELHNISILNTKKITSQKYFEISIVLVSLLLTFNI